MTVIVPQICIDFGPSAFWGILFVSCGLSAYVSHWVTKVSRDRDWEADIRRRASQQVFAPWQAMGEPVLLSRVDAEATIFKRRPYREEGFDLREAA